MNMTHKPNIEFTDPNTKEWYDKNVGEMGVKIEETDFSKLQGKWVVKGADEVNIDNTPNYKVKLKLSWKEDEGSV